MVNFPSRSVTVPFPEVPFSNTETPIIGPSALEVTVPLILSFCPYAEAKHPNRIHTHIKSVFLIIINVLVLKIATKKCIFED